jgi:hypothetical protein
MKYLRKYTISFYVTDVGVSNIDDKCHSIFK